MVEGEGSDARGWPKGHCCIVIDYNSAHLFKANQTCPAKFWFVRFSALAGAPGVAWGEVWGRLSETWFCGTGVADVDDDCDAVRVCWSGVLKLCFSNCWKKLLFSSFISFFSSLYSHRSKDWHLVLYSVYVMELGEYTHMVSSAIDVFNWFWRLGLPLSSLIVQFYIRMFPLVSDIEKDCG